MGFISAFKGLKLLKKPGNGRLNNLNDPDRPQCVNKNFCNSYNCYQIPGNPLMNSTAYSGHTKALPNHIEMENSFPHTRKPRTEVLLRYPGKIQSDF